MWPGPRDFASAWSGPWIRSTSRLIYKCTDSCTKLLCITVYIVCFNSKYRNSCFLQRFFHRISLYVIKAAEFQIYINNSIHFIFFCQADNIINSCAVWCKTCTVDSHISFCNSVDLFIYRRLCLIYKAFKISCAGAHFFTDNCSSACFYQIMDLPVWNSQRCSCQHNSLCSFRKYAHTICYSVFQFVAQFICHFCKSCGIIIECDL